MENLRRTTEHLARIAQRQVVLRDFATAALSPETSIVWEVGCGHGHFLTAYASAHPEEVCIGLDLIGERIERATRKRNRAKLDQLYFVHASAEDFLETLPVSVRIGTVFILFPDPWPKRRHHKNRIMQPEFLEKLARFSTVHARLHFRTDDQAYFTAASRVIESHPRWKMIDAPWPFEHETVFQQRAASYQSLIAQVIVAPEQTS